ncbi:MAG: 4Fe-4S binding protein [Oscillospiraceae bacterium]
MSARPEASAQCIGCGKCAGLCPAKAITMVPGARPAIRQRPVHSLFLLSGILPGGRHGGAPDCHCQNVESVGNCHETNCIF